MSRKLLEEIHPGEILLEEFMKPMGITARQLAADMDVPPSRISDIVNGGRPITADTALRLGLFFSRPLREAVGWHAGPGAWIPGQARDDWELGVKVNLRPERSQNGPRRSKRLKKGHFQASNRAVAR